MKGAAAPVNSARPLVFEALPDPVPVGFMLPVAVPLLAMDEETGGPLQNPPLHLLNAHCWSEVQDAWKLPHTGCSMELTA